jgi:hypothetical protein
VVVRLTKPLRGAPYSQRAFDAVTRPAEGRPRHFHIDVCIQKSIDTTIIGGDAAENYFE